MTSASVSRTERPRARTSAAAFLIAASCSSASSARAWPIDSEPAGHLRANLAGQPQQPQDVGHRRAVLPHRLRHLLLRAVELVHHPPVGEGLLDRVQVLALDVLDRAPTRAAGASSPGATSFTTTGTLRRPACWAARQRRSPAMIW